MSEEVEHFIHSLKVTELRDELKKRGLSYAGLKAALAERLTEAMLQEKGGNSEGGGEKTNLTTDKSESPIPISEGQGEENSVANETTEDNEVEPQPVEQDQIKSEKNPEIEQIEQIEPEKSPEEQVEPEKSSEEQAEPELQEKEDINVKVEEPALQPSEQSEEEDGMDYTVVDSTEPPSQDESEEKKEEMEVAEVKKENDDVQETNNGDEKTEMETSNEKKRSPESGGAVAGVKRSRDSEERDASPKDDKKKPDPRNVPDPEELKDWNDEKVKAICENLFVVADTSTTVTLDPCNSDLDFIIQPDGLGGSPLTDGGLAYLLSGTKATWGVKKGKYFYECKIEEELSTDLPETEECPYLVRVGWSPLEGTMVVGEERFSFGYENSGQKVNGKSKEEYGEEYTVGDIITCYIDLSSDSKTISFTKNGENMSQAFVIDDTTERLFFPHVTTKNIRISFNFGSQPSSFPPEEGYSFIQEAAEEERDYAVTAPTSKGDCEVIFTVGLPGSGKTNWIGRQMAKYPEKRYTVLGVSQLVDRMKATGLPDRMKQFTQWSEIKEIVFPMLNVLFVIAINTNRNYIVDQVNVYFDSQKRKVKVFEGFDCKCIVCIPPHHELRKRKAEQIKEGTYVEMPLDVLDAMKANFHIPQPEDEVFDNIMFSEIYGHAAEKIVRQYKDDALGLSSNFIPSNKRSRYDSHRSYGYGGGGGGGGSYGYGGGHSYHGPKGGPYGRPYHPPPPPPPPHSRYGYGPQPYRSGYYPPPPPPPHHHFGHPRGRYPPAPAPRYGSPRGGGGGGGYYSSRGGGYYGRY